MGRNRKSSSQPHDHRAPIHAQNQEETTSKPLSSRSIEKRVRFVLPDEPERDDHRKAKFREAKKNERDTESKICGRSHGKKKHSAENSSQQRLPEGRSITKANKSPEPEQWSKNRANRAEKSSRSIVANPVHKKITGPRKSALKQPGEKERIIYIPNVTYDSEVENGTENDVHATKATRYKELAGKTTAGHPPFQHLEGNLGPKLSETYDTQEGLGKPDHSLEHNVSVTNVPTTAADISYSTANDITNPSRRYSDMRPYQQHKSANNYQDNRGTFEMDEAHQAVQKKDFNIEHPDVQRVNKMARHKNVDHNHDDVEPGFRYRKNDISRTETGRNGEMVPRKNMYTLAYNRNQKSPHGRYTYKLETNNYPVMKINEKRDEDDDYLDMTPKYPRSVKEDLHEKERRPQVIPQYPHVPNTKLIRSYAPMKQEIERYIREPRIYQKSLRPVSASPNHFYKHGHKQDREVPKIDESKRSTPRSGALTPRLRPRTANQRRKGEERNANEYENTTKSFKSTGHPDQPCNNDTNVHKNNNNTLVATPSTSRTRLQRGTTRSFSATKFPTRKWTFTNLTNNALTPRLTDSRAIPRMPSARLARSYQFELRSQFVTGDARKNPVLSDRKAERQSFRQSVRDGIKRQSRKEPPKFFNGFRDTRRDNHGELRANYPYGPSSRRTKGNLETETPSSFLLRVAKKLKLNENETLPSSKRQDSANSITRPETKERDISLNEQRKVVEAIPTKNGNNKVKTMKAYGYSTSPGRINPSSSRKSTETESSARSAKPVTMLQSRPRSASTNSLKHVTMKNKDIRGEAAPFVVMKSGGRPLPILTVDNKTYGSKNTKAYRGKGITPSEAHQDLSTFNRHPKTTPKIYITEATCQPSGFTMSKENVGLNYPTFLHQKSPRNKTPRRAGTRVRPTSAVADHSKRSTLTTRTTQGPQKTGKVSPSRAARRRTEKSPSKQKELDKIANLEECLKRLEKSLAVKENILKKLKSKDQPTQTGKIIFPSWTYPEIDLRKNLFAQKIQHAGTLSLQNPRDLPTHCQSSYDNTDCLRNKEQKRKHAKNESHETEIRSEGTSTICVETSVCSQTDDSATSLEDSFVSSVTSTISGLVAEVKGLITEAKQKSLQSKVFSQDVHTNIGYDNQDDTINSCQDFPPGPTSCSVREEEEFKNYTFQLRAIATELKQVGDNLVQDGVKGRSRTYASYVQRVAYAVDLLNKLRNEMVDLNEILAKSCGR